MLVLARKTTKHSSQSSNTLRCLGICRRVSCQHKHDAGINACMITRSPWSFSRNLLRANEHQILTSSTKQEIGTVRSPSSLQQKARQVQEALTASCRYSPGTVHSLHGLHIVSLDPTCVSNAIVALKRATIDWSVMELDTTLQRHVIMLPCCSLSVT